MTHRRPQGPLLVRRVALASALALVIALATPSLRAADDAAEDGADALLETLGSGRKAKGERRKAKTGELQTLRRSPYAIRHSPIPI